MTYINRVLREWPAGLWSMDSLPLSDSSGYGRNATYGGSPITTRPIVARGIAAQHLNSGDSISYPMDKAMVSGRENQPFSLEAWIKPSTGKSSVIARGGSGLFLDNLKLSFSIERGVSQTVEYNLQAGNIYYVVATYDGIGINLFVDGAKVASAELSDETLAAGFVSSEPNLTTSTSSRLTIDSVAVYAYVLSASAIYAHYRMGSDYPVVEDLSALNGGTYFEFVDESTGLYRKTAFPEYDWDAGLFEAVVSINDTLVNLYDAVADQYQAGSWTFQESFEPAEETIRTSRITWNASENVTVEMSEDGGTTWNVLTNGGRIVSNKSLVNGYAVSIRVSIPASSEQIQVFELTTAFYSSLDIRGSDDELPAVVRNPTMTTVAKHARPASSFNDNAGINLTGAANGLSIAGDDDFGGYFAVEMTVKVDASSTGATVLWVNTETLQPQITTDSGGAWTFSNLDGVYVDGVEATSPADIAPGVWHHVIATFPESLATVYIGNNVSGTAGYAMRIGHLATYSDPISDSDANLIYKTWVGSPAVQIDCGSSSDVGETAPPFRGYSADWAIVSGG